MREIDIITRAACYATGIDREMLQSRSRLHRIVFTRHLIAVTAIEKLGMNYTEAGKLIGLERSAVHNATYVINGVRSAGFGEDAIWLGIFDAMVGEVE